MTTKRVIYVDVLRIVAIFMVVVIHVSSSNWFKPGVDSFEWQVFNIFDSITRSAVPIFVMISGMFFLNPTKQFSIESLYKKNIVGLLVPYIFWSIVYAIFTFYYRNLEWNENSFDWFIKYIIESDNILWYLPMLMGVYILVPVLRPITEEKNKKALQYILIVFFIFGIVIRTLNQFDLNENLLLILNKIQLDGFVQYVGYFLLGYYLFTFEFKKKWRIVIYILGIASVFATIFVGQHFALQANRPYNLLFGNHMLTSFFEGMAIIVFFKSNKFIAKIGENPNIRRRIVQFSGITFGIYLIHDMIIKIFLRLGFSTLSFNPIFSVVVISITVFIVSAFLSYLLRKIPLFKNHLM